MTASQPVAPTCTSDGISPCYLAYGLRISSALPLPELSSSADASVEKCDLAIGFDRIDWRPPQGEHLDGYVCGDNREAYIYIGEVGTFCVQGGCRITIDRAPGVSDGRLRVFLLGGALGLLLNQRGLLVLHASAMMVAGGAIAFLGDSGEGKSTMAGAMYRSGYPVLADDMVAVDTSGAQPTIIPGSPRIKLWSEAAARLGYNPAELSEFDTEDERRECRTSGAFAHEPLPIHAFYRLESGRATLIERLTLQDSFQVLIRNAYAAGLLGRSGATPRFFTQCVQVVADVPVFRLRRRRAIAALPALTVRVATHAAQHPAAEVVR